MSRRFASTLAIRAAALAALVACDGPVTPPIPPGLVRPVVAPAALPAPVVMDCPATWQTVVEADGSTVCEPWDGERPSCAADELLLAGAGCVPLTPCGDAPVDLPPDALWVDVSAAEGGDGSRVRPFATLDAALLATGTTIALLPGVHALGRRVVGRTIVGACPRTTEIDVVALTPIQLTNTIVRSVRLTSATEAELQVPRGATLTLASVAIEGLDRITVDGVLSARDVAFRGVGSAVVGYAGSAITLERVSVETAARNGIYVGEADLARATLTATDVVVVGSGAASPGDAFHISNATIELDRIVVEDADAGIGAAFGTEVTARDVLVRRVGAPALYVGPGSGSFDDVRIVDTPNGILWAEGTYTASDLVVTRAGYLGLAIVAADVELTRARISGTSAAGIDVDGTLRASDLSISEVVGAPSVMNVTGSGVVVEPGGAATLERVLVERVEGYGVGARAARLDGVDLTIRDVAAQPGTFSGAGVLATESAVLDLARVDVARSETVGIAIEASTAILEDVRVADVRVHDELEGSGIVVLGESGPAMLELERAHVSRTVRWGFIAHGDATVDVVDIEVVGVASAPCGASTCAGYEAGGAIAMSTGSRGTIRRFFAEEADLAGVVATANIRLELSEGRAARNTYGLLVSTLLAVNQGESPGIDLEDVELDENEEPHASTDVMVGVPMLDDPGRP